MSFNKGVKFFAFLAIVFATLACCSTELKAGWQLVQNHPIRIYRDTRTGKLWSVTISNAGNSNSNARRIVNKYGLRLPSWDELRDVVNNNGAISTLEMEDGFLDLYETDNPNVLAGAYGGSIDTKRPRQPIITQTWVLGVRP